MSIIVDHKKAKSVLSMAWGDIKQMNRPPARMQQLIEDVMAASDVTFKYILATGYLAKCVNHAAHPRALQASSALTGAYDARSLCHKVVIGFEKSKGNLFGLSNEPFVNKPARHPEHDGMNRQLRNKSGAKLLHRALEIARTGKPKDVYLGLVHILRLGLKHSESQKSTIVQSKVNLEKVLTFIKTFLAETDGGCRLVSVWGAFQALLSEGGEIKVCSPNASDYFGKTCGDVEVYYHAVLVSASECKQRPLNTDDVNHGIKKAQEKGVPEYLFINSAGMIANQKETIRKAVKSHANEIDLTIIDIWEHAPLLAVLLNPSRRGQFGTKVAELLRKMRKYESANVAASLWNSIIAPDPN